MNSNSEKAIRKELDSKNSIIKIAGTGDKYAQHRCLMTLADEANSHARAANASEICLAIKNTLFDIMTRYQKREIDSGTFLRNVADAFAVLNNDIRDGLLLIDELFGTREGVDSTKKNDQALQQACGTADWSEIVRDFFKRIYEENPEEPIKDEEPVEEDEQTLEELLAELEGLIGLSAVKQEVNSFINLLRICSERERRGLESPEITMHLVFTGNPGTGKTTVARLLAKIYKKLGILTKGHLVEVERADLCGGYVGQTAIKTKEVIEKAMGGVLFIDEAYSLSNNKSENDYGHEAIETLLKSMEDHRRNLVVIAAGYSDLMDTFINSNPGLKSRFNKFIEFADYTPEELNAIFLRLCEKNGFQLDDFSSRTARQFFEKYYRYRDSHYANARDVRNFFEKAITIQANRLSQDSLKEIETDIMVSFTRDDIAKAAIAFGVPITMSSLED